METSEFGLDLDGSHAPFVVVTVRGEVDLYTSLHLKDTLAEIVREGHRQVVADLDQASLLDSTGVGVLLDARKRLRRNTGDLTLVCSQPNIPKMFGIMGATTVFRWCGSVEEATGCLTGAGL